MVTPDRLALAGCDRYGPNQRPRETTEKRGSSSTALKFPSNSMSDLVSLHHLLLVMPGSGGRTSSSPARCSSLATDASLVEIQLAPLMFTGVCLLSQTRTGLVRSMNFNSDFPGPKLYFTPRPASGAKMEQNGHCSTSGFPLTPNFLKDLSEDIYFLPKLPSKSLMDTKVRRV
ncbi:hypothetical protein RRG08_063776 [Elysia crispata]|uniref:Uncharacterized protein n=1 Tax=Elysia crispata TaxID=231223 RepID=A0AAE1E0H7_9GAST|nr:hypothetical protein RRG08_063776 [Elysia crispata]